MKERKQIKISEIIKLLENGYTRKNIAEKYDLKPIELKRLFSHPELKGKRTKLQSFDIIDDTIKDDQNINW